MKEKEEEKIKLTYLFPGWWNSCYHWSMAIYAGIGRTKAYIDLVNMETEIKTLIKTLLPGLVGLGVSFQLLSAIGMIWFSQGTLRPPTMQEEEPERLYVGLLHKAPPRISTLNFVTGLRKAENGNSGGWQLGVVAEHEEQDIVEQEYQQQMEENNTWAVDNQDIPLLPFQQRPRRRNTEKG